MSDTDTSYSPKRRVGKWEKHYLKKLGTSNAKKRAVFEDKLRMIRTGDYKCRWCEKQFTRVGTWKEHKYFCKVHKFKSTVKNMKAWRELSLKRNEIYQWRYQCSKQSLEKENEWLKTQDPNDIQAMKECRQYNKQFDDDTPKKGRPRNSVHVCRDHACKNRLFKTTRQLATHRYYVHGKGKEKKTKKA